MSEEEFNEYVINSVTFGEQFFSDAAQHLKKGRQAYVEGQIRSHSWEDREGKKRTAVDIVVDSVVPLGSRGDDGGGEPARSAAPSRAAKSSSDDFGEPASQEITDDDIPF